MDTSKIIKAYIRDGTYSTTEPITQGDYGYILQIEGTVLPPVYRVDFSNDRHKGEALPVYGNENGVEVPEELIATGKDIFAFYFYIKENFGKTAYTWKIPNDTRAQNGDREPTPTQQDSIDQLIVRSNEAVERAEQAKADAETAQGKAEDAQEAAETAERNAEQSATASAQSAEASARCSSDAQESAEEAEQFTHRAEEAQRETTELVEEAQRYVNTAGSAARDAETYANNAYGYARSANESANTASTKAGEASASATTASNKAGEASGYADTASQKATESAQSASQASGYKDTAEQAKNDAQTAKTDAEDARDNAQTAQELAENAESNAESTVHGVLDSLDIETTSGSIVETHDAFPVSPEKMVVDINPIQDLSHGDPSPENICPISGWTGMNLKDTGKNLLGGDFLLSNAQRYIPGGITNEEEEYFQFSAGASIDNSYRFSSGVPFKENTRYTFIFTLYKTSGTGSNMRVNYTDGSYGVIPTLSSAGVKETVVYVSAEGKSILNLTKTNMSSSTRLYYNESGIFEGVLTVDDFKPYVGRTIPISWQSEAGTVYGGKLDVLTGELTVDRAMVDLGTLNWNRSNNNGVWSHYLFYTNIQAQTLQKNYMCSAYPIASLANITQSPTDKAIYGLKTNTYIYIRDDDYATATDFKSAVTGQTLVYELAEPIEIQLTPQQITLFKDYNALWADTGDISEFAYKVGEFATKADIPEVPVEDVQVNGTSVVENKVANIDLSGIEQNAEDIASLEEDIYKPYAVDSASGAIASFPDGADDIPLKSLIVDINPVQDLHGYDSPWPAGGGVNLLPFEDALTEGWTNTQDGITATYSKGYMRVTGTNTSSTWNDIVSFKNEWIQQLEFGAGDYVASDHLYIRVQIDDSPYADNKSATFNVSSSASVRGFYITVGAGVTVDWNVPMMFVRGTTRPTTFAPYENICPISGWTEVDVEQSGVNVWDEEWEVGIFNGNGEPSIATDRIRSKNFCSCVPNTEYCFVIPNKNIRIYFYDADKTFLEYFGYWDSTRTFTTPAKACFFKILGSAAYSTTYNHDISINYPSTDHDYHPYTGRSITINLGQTVYGGKLDVLSGKLTVDRAMVDLGTLNWVYRSTGYNTKPFTAPLTNALLSPQSTVIIPALCSMYPQIAPYKMNTPTNDKCFGIGHYFNGQHEIQILDTAYTDATTFKTAVTGQQLVYRLAEPLEIQLTPHEVNSLLGQNNIFADTGDSAVEYRADTRLYIEKLTQPEEDDMIADSAITNGQFFMVGNTLYRALANIASGATITVGTNAQRVSLADALNLINT